MIIFFHVSCGLKILPSEPAKESVKVMDEKQKFSHFFEAFKSNYTIQLMNEEQSQNLKRLQESREKIGISLSQADEWMMRAGLIKKKVLSITETGLVFSKFRWFVIKSKQKNNWNS